MQITQTLTRQCLGLMRASEVTVLRMMRGVAEGSSTGQNPHFVLSPMRSPLPASDTQDEYKPNRDQWPGASLTPPLPQAAEAGEIIRSMARAWQSSCCLDARAPFVTERAGIQLPPEKQK